jgi:hypothetical protein
MWTPDPRTLRAPAALGPRQSPHAMPLPSPRLAAATLAALLLAGALAAGVLSLGPSAPAVPQASLHDRVAANYGQLPLRFEANRGQVDAQVRYVSRGPGYSLFLTSGAAVLSLAGEQPGTDAVVRMRLLGADPSPRIEGTERLPGHTNYLTGSDPKAWQTNVPSFAGVRYHEVYPGIDVAYHGTQRKLEYDFVVAPRVDPGTIRMQFGGSGSAPVLDRNGDLVIATRGGELRQPRPVVYQQIGGTRRTVPGRYVLHGGGKVGFALGAYDRDRTLVIDPVLSYATFLGAAGADTPGAIAVDTDGNAYVTGSTASTDFPTKNAAQAVKGAGATSDAFVSKLNADGSELVYSTYLGGGDADVGRGIAVDATGAYVVGSTASANFPTANALQAAKGAGATTDAFVAKLNISGALVYSTYLGGDLADTAFAVAVESGRAYVAGSTASTNFPIANALQATNGGTTDAFAARLNTAGSALEYSTYLGGTAADSASGVALDGTSALLTGQTASTAFPTANALQASHGGATDAFVTKLNAAGTALSYSTYLGGSGADNADAIAVRSGSAFVAGDTSSTNFPTASPLQAANAGGGDAFVTKLNAAGSALSYSTYLGGGQSDGANGIAVGADGRASIVGTTSSGDYPLRDPVGVKEGNADFLVSQLDAAGAELVHSTALGGSASESGMAIAVDAAGSSYFTGSSAFYATGDVPTASATAPLQADSAGGTDAFVAKIAAGDPAAPLVTELKTRSGTVEGRTSVRILGRNLSGATAVSFGGTPATSFTVDSATSITAVSPARAAGFATIRVTTPAGTSPANPAARYEYATGSWTQTGSLITARSVHTTTLLEGGKVLVTGGRATGTLASLTSSELYDPKAGTWSATGALDGSRFGHSATLLDGPECQGAPRPAYCGKVLVAGGYTGSSSANAQPVLSTSELYDPVAGTWSAGGTLNTRRSLHAATLLADGRVLVAGGRTCDQPPPAVCDFTFRSAEAEIYNPATNTWTTTGTLFIPRHTNRAALLPDGRVLLPAGFDQTGNNSSAELFSPTTGTWSSCPTPAAPTPDCPGSLLAGRARAGGTLLLDGRVIVAGGFPNTNTAELYDPSTGAWSGTGLMKGNGRFNHYYALLPDGRYLLAGGGNGGSTAELYDPATGTWSSAGRMSVSHGTSSSNANSQDAVVLSSDPASYAADPAVCGTSCGKVLVTGNTDDRATDLFTPFAEPAPAPPPPPPPAAAPPPPPPPPPPVTTTRRAAALQVQRASLRGRRLELRATVSALATGRLSVRVQAAGRTVRFNPQIRNGAVRLSTTLSRAQSRQGSVTLSLSYAGNARVRRESARLRAGRNAAGLAATSARIASGRLRVSGTISRRARGAVRISLVYATAAGGIASVSHSVTIRSGRFSSNRALPGAAAKAGGQLTILYAGALRGSVAGRQISRQIAAGP